MKSKLLSSGLVYSTDSGRMCPDCRQAKADCRCAALAARPTGDGIVRVSRETKGRAGKGVTLVRGVPLDAPALVVLGKQLKSACGSGGTVKDGVIEVQGDHCDRGHRVAQGPKLHRQARWRLTLNPEDLQLLVTRTMPFGKYKGRLIADLPADYLLWFVRGGVPKGEIGRLIALMHEIDHNGLSDLLKPLRQR